MNEIQHALQTDALASQAPLPEAERVGLNRIVSAMAKVREAQKAVSRSPTLEAARTELLARGATFAENGLAFNLEGISARLQGPRGEVGASRAARAKRKAQRRARRANRG